MVYSEREQVIRACIEQIIEHIGDNPERQGLKDTPDRVLRAYREMFSGYKTDVAKIFKTFDEVHDQMIVMKGIEFFSTCEHHMLPFFGVAHVAYIPRPKYGKVIGASKLVRVVEAFSRRLQIQERLTNEITKTIEQYLDPRGVACIIEGTHLCMQIRGVKQTPEMVTSSMTGAFLDDEDNARQEFLSLIRR